MYSGEKLGQALAEAIEKKGVKKAEVARFFGIKQPSLSDWIKSGRIGKQHIDKLIEYFSDVVEPSHFGIDSLVFNQSNHGSGTQNNVIGTQNNFLSESSGCLKTMLMPDDSMTPVIPENTSLQVDKTDTNIRNGKTYLIQYGGMEQIRKVVAEPNNQIRLTPYNTQDYNTYVVPREQVEILGRVVSWKVSDK